MLTTGVSNNNTFSLVDKGYAANFVLQTGQRIIYEGEEAQIIRLSPFLVVKTSNRVICCAMFNKIEQVKNALPETV